VFTPVKNLTGTVDWWMIKVKDAISNIPPATLLNKCIFDNLYCNLIQRDLQQTLWLFPAGKCISFNDNLGGFDTRGLDLGVNYAVPMAGLGSLGFSFLELGS